ncbi:hypothetical protein SDC9_120324 [bioreactor metagenome]|uniref:Uncharacterized protein n=1 Tax=bioreactor metagenome TaxID=1076179 RepID=A0A645C9P8_9ZZZZ
MSEFRPGAEQIGFGQRDQLAPHQFGMEGIVGRTPEQGAQGFGQRAHLNQIQRRSLDRLDVQRRSRHRLAVEIVGIALAGHIAEVAAFDGEIGQLNQFGHLRQIERMRLKPRAGQRQAAFGGAQPVDLELHIVLVLNPEHQIEPGGEPFMAEVSDVAPDQPGIDILEFGRSLAVKFLVGVGDGLVGMQRRNVGDILGRQHQALHHQRPRRAVDQNRHFGFVDDDAADRPVSDQPVALGVAPGVVLKINQNDAVVDFDGLHAAFFFDVEQQRDDGRQLRRREGLEKVIGHDLVQCLVPAFEFGAMFGNDVGKHVSFVAHDKPRFENPSPFILLLLI